MNGEERKAIDWLKNKPQECTDIIRSCSNLQNKKAYAKDRTMYKALINFIEKQNSIIKNAVDYIQHNNKELKNYSEQEMLDWLYGLDKCYEIKEDK